MRKKTLKRPFLNLGDNKAKFQFLSSQESVRMINTNYKKS